MPRAPVSAFQPAIAGARSSSGTCFCTEPWMPRSIAAPASPLARAATHSSRRSGATTYSPSEHTPSNEPARSAKIPPRRSTSIPQPTYETVVAIAPNTAIVPTSAERQPQPVDVDERVQRRRRDHPAAVQRLAQHHPLQRGLGRQDADRLAPSSGAAPHRSTPADRPPRARTQHPAPPRWPCPAVHRHDRRPAPRSPPPARPRPPCRSRSAR